MEEMIEEGIILDTEAELEKKLKEKIAMDKDDLEYVDSIVDTAAQDIRHYFDLTDEETLAAIRNSLDRLEAKI